MDNLYAIGVGLVLRATIDKITHHNHRVNGSLVGLWEGAVLHHFLSKTPYSLDPYIAFGFRLIVDLLLTTNVTRLVLVIIWTGMGMLLSDVGWDVAEDKRFRRLYRRVRRALPSSLKPSSQARSSSRVQFSHLPAGSSSTTVSSGTGRSPPSILISRSQPLSQTRTRPPPTPARRPTTTPLPGSFSEFSEASSLVSPSPRSEVSSVVSPARGSEASSVPSRASGSQVPPRMLPPRVRTPSELEYVSLPVIPDTPGIEYTSFTRRASSVASGGLTTSSEGSGRHAGAAFSPPPRNYSGLTTPVERPSTPRGEQLPPVTIIEVGDSAGQRTPTMTPIEFADQPPIPIPMRHSLVTPELADAVPSPAVMPPVDSMPMIPSTPEVDYDAARTERAASSRGPPPEYEQVVADDASVGPSEAPSVVTEKSRGALINKADKLREEAQALEANRDRLRREYFAAQQGTDYWKAFRLKIERDRVEQEAKQLHAKAERRYFKAHNFTPEPQTIDVHRLKVPEAVARVEQALYDAMVTGVPELRIITGRGNHSKGKIPVLKLAIIGAMQDHHIEVKPDETNPGLVLIHPPTNPSKPGPSTS
ncbi:uncharacterized protein C8Q71DRAFT_504502 [Rhodofomes roseus]|uniref:Smr domain-containing protein n=1 Tax=Rhodofomes roseus TaxID=34475 RepID=A0ABQ8KMB8_9APHY|nr:uncharacterized protein C8Q71DRAFT_504502 [Rhodofomes roseus]KAH9839259.1 hypothetical protein C8Q71DRAFT_504502 [Rhodofomes roseus]